MMDNRVFCKVYSDICRFKLEYIKKGLVNSFFKPSIYCIENSDYKLVFDTSNYVKLSKLSELSSYNFVNVLLNVATNIEIAKDYLINPNEYVISKDTIFVKLDSRDKVLDVKMIFKYYPANISEKNVFLNVINSLNDMLDDEGRIYKNDIYTYIEKVSPTYINIINHLNNLKKEIKTFEKY